MKKFAEIFSPLTYRIPMPVTEDIKTRDSTYPLCPRCKISMDREYMAFCDRCGQRLSWNRFPNEET